MGCCMGWWEKLVNMTGPAHPRQGHSPAPLRAHRTSLSNETPKRGRSQSLCDPNPATDAPKGSGSPRTAMLESLSNSAAPQNPQAWPPISRHRTCCSAIEERTPGIGFRIKDASKRDVSLPEPGTLLSPLQRTHPVPLRPFFADKFFSARFERPFLHAGLSRCLQEKAHPVFQTAATRHFG